MNMTHPHGGHDPHAGHGTPDQAAHDAHVVGDEHAGHDPQAGAGHAGHAGHDSAVEDGGPHRFTADEVTTLLTGAGFTGITLHAVRVFADLVPGALVGLEPGAAEALVDLERAVADRPEYLPLATQVHALARLG